MRSVLGFQVWTGGAWKYDLAEAWGFKEWLITYLATDAYEDISRFPLIVNLRTIPQGVPLRPDLFAWCFSELELFCVPCR